VRNEWVALEDDEGLQPVDNFVPAVRTEIAEDVAPVLDAVSATLSVEAMQEMIAQVAIEGQNPDAVAGDYLEGLSLPDADLSGLSVTVGSANFPESEITAELYAQALRAAGASVDVRPNFGARETYFPALSQGDLDIVPEFVGTLGFYLDGDAEITSDLDATLEVVRPLAEAEGVTLLEPAEADSVNTFVVTAETAERYGLSTVSDLAGVSDSLTLGGPPECPERPLCLQGLIDVYGLSVRCVGGPEVGATIVGWLGTSLPTIGGRRSSWLTTTSGSARCSGACWRTTATPWWPRHRRRPTPCASPPRRAPTSCCST
jgi:osmoprotectant transport system substrate-binding protein